MNYDDMILKAKELFESYDADRKINLLENQLKSTINEKHLYEEKAKKYYNYSIAISIVAILASIIIGISCYSVAYKKGFKDNQPYSDDGSPTVYITPSGSKYHAKYCDYVNGNAIEISLEQAEAQGYTDCSKCVTPR